MGMTMYAFKFPVSDAIIGTAACAGAALLPDIDHPRSTVSNTYGPLTRGLSWVMNTLTGGHRRGTHSLPGIFVMGLLAQAGVLYRETTAGMIGLSLIMSLLASALVRLLRIPGWLDDLAPIPVVVGLVCLTDISLDILPVAIMAGCVVHVAGDILTKTTCPVFWPFSNKGIKLALFKTNGPFERFVMLPGTVALILVEILGKWVDKL
jgi:membrane-bound metal-dependent hydrolase YbcI (DUF457 family)